MVPTSVVAAAASRDHDRKLLPAARRPAQSAPAAAGPGSESGAGSGAGPGRAPLTPPPRRVVKALRLHRKQLLGTEEEEGVELLCDWLPSCQPTTAGLILASLARPRALRPARA